MDKISRGVRLMLGAAGIAVAAYLALALPGLLSDRDSTSGQSHGLEVRR